MTIPGDDPTPWALLRDGQIVALTQRASTIVIDLELPRVRRRFPGGGAVVKVTLEGCTEFVFQPWDEPPIDDPGGIVGSAPDLVGARVEPGVGALPAGMTVECASGELRLRYRSLAVSLDDGTEVSLGELVGLAASDAAAWAPPGAGGPPGGSRPS